VRFGGVSTQERKEILFEEILSFSSGLFLRMIAPLNLKEFLGV
jgi:hypothetical protein